ncbi:hypothetical protein HKX48_008412 [Thoreauomyces humboldtii]|nr:hypothetical protein HKX48_008412 [Thoreauomyces humboldtii]
MDAGMGGPFEVLPDFAACRVLPDVQALTANWQMILALATSVPALIAIPMVGALSDRVGRKPALLLPVLSGLVGVIGLLAVAQFGAPIYVLLCAHLLQGCLGGYTAIMMLVYAYLADVVAVDRRSQVFTSVEALMFAAFTAGPYCGGVLTRMLPSGVIGVFWISVVGKLIALAYVLFILPESLHHTDGHTASSHAIESPSTPKPTLWSRLTPPRSLIAHLCTPPRTHLLLIAFAAAICVGGLPLFFLFCSYRFGWDAYDEGVYLLYLSVTRMGWMLGVGGLIDRAVTPKAGGSVDDREFSVRKVTMDVRVVRVGMVLAGVGWAAIGLVPEGWMVYAISFVTGFATLAKPTIRSLLSRSTPPLLQGRLFSAIQLLDQSAGVISSLVFPPIWSHTVGTSVPGLFLMVMGALFLVAGAIAGLGLNVERMVSGLHQHSLEVGGQDEEDEETREEEDEAIAVGVSRDLVPPPLR